MFGQFVYTRDAGLRKGAGSATTTEDYAAELASELITRARVLEPLVLRAVETEDRGTRADYLEALEDLARAVQVYLLDVEEAAVRGQRALLFGRSGMLGGAGVTRANAPDPAEVEALGGAFAGTSHA